MQEGSINIMDLEKIQRIQWKYILEMRWDRFSATQVFSHLIEELGEVVSHFLYEERYKVRGAGHEGTESDLGSEFAQAFGLFLQLASMAGIDLEEEWKKEMERNRERFSVDVWRRLAEEG